MKSSSKTLKSRRRLHIRVAGAVLLAIGLGALGTSVAMSGVPSAVVLIAGALILLGTLLVASPETFAMVLEALFLLP